MLHTCNAFAVVNIAFSLMQARPKVFIHFYTGKSSSSTQVNTEFSISGSKIAVGHTSGISQVLIAMILRIFSISVSH
jgi:hypothetical protein